MISEKKNPGTKNHKIIIQQINQNYRVTHTHNNIMPMMRQRMFYFKSGCVRFCGWVWEINLGVGVACKEIEFEGGMFA